MHVLKIVAASLAVTCLLPLRARADETVARPPAASITVTGQGQVSRSPDVATVSATVVTNDDNAGRALSENNRRYAALTAKLAALGIVGADLRSTSLTSNFNPRPKNSNEAAAGQLFGFIVTRDVQVDVRALDQTGAVIDAANAAGVTQIGGVSYGLRDRKSAERAALAAAVGDAYEQAQTIAAAAHVQIVGVLHVNASAAPGRVMPMAAMLSARAAEAPVPTQIVPGDLTVSSTVVATYAIR